MLRRQPDTTVVSPRPPRDSLAHSPGRSAEMAWDCLKVGTATGALVMLLYLASSAPGVLWGDSAKLTLRALDLSLGPNPRDHPGYVLVAGILVRIIPMDPARVLNLASGVFGGLTAGLLAWFACRSFGRMAGVGAGAALGVAHLFWHSAAMAESYTLSALFLVVVLLLSHRYATRPSLPLLCWIALVAGLGTTVNAIVGILTPAALVLLWRGRKETRAYWIPLGIGCFAAGLTPFLIGAWVQGDLSAVVTGTVGEGGWFFTGPGALLQEVARYPAYLAYQFPSPALFLVVLGAATVWRQDRYLAWALGLAWLIDVLFGAAWLRQRQFMIFSTGLLFPALLAGVGLSRITKGPRGGQGPAVALLVMILLCPVAVYSVTPPLSGRLGMDLTGARTVPYRGQSFFLRPWKTGYEGPARFASEAVEVASPGDLIIADFTLLQVLEYERRQERGRGVELLGIDQYIRGNRREALVQRIAQELDTGRRVFLADDEPEYYFLGTLRERFELTPVGSLLEVLPRRPRG